MIVATVLKSKPEHSIACQCEACKRYVDGLQEECAYCKQLFRLREIKYLKGDFGYTHLCATCFDLPETDVFLPYWDRMRLGMVSDDEIANWNARHDM